MKITYGRWCTKVYFFFQQMLNHHWNDQRLPSCWFFFLSITLNCRSAERSAQKTNKNFLRQSSDLKEKNYKTDWVPQYSLAFTTPQITNFDFWKNIYRKLFCAPLHSQSASLIIFVYEMRQSDMRCSSILLSPNRHVQYLLLYVAWMECVIYRLLRYMYVQLLMCCFGFLLSVKSLAPSTSTAIEIKDLSVNEWTEEERKRNKTNDENHWSDMNNKLRFALLFFSFLSSLLMR